MNELTQLEERIKNRQRRRWKRRARIMAPFAALPLLVCMLVLSIDIVEYSPVPPPQKRAEKPVHEQAKRIQPSPEARVAISTSAITQASVLDTDRVSIPSLGIANDLDDAAATATTGSMRPSQSAERNR